MTPAPASTISLDVDTALQTAAASRTKHRLARGVGLDHKTGSLLALDQVSIKPIAGGRGKTASSTKIVDQFGENTSLWGPARSDPVSR